MTVLTQVLQLFMLAAVGFLMVKLKLWNDSTLAALTSLIVRVASPCMTFSKLERMAPGQIAGAWGLTFLLSMPLVAVLLGLGFLLFRKQPYDKRAVYAQTVALSNCGFVGYPVIEAALGPQAVVYGVAFCTAFNVISWSVGVALFSGDFKKGLRHIVNPTMASIVLGLLFQLIGLKLPQLVSNTVETLGNLATPVSMLIAGAYLEKVTRALMKDARFWLSCLLRLTATPLLVLGLIRLLGFGGDPAGAVFICCAMPGSSNMLVQASAYSTVRAREQAVGAVAVTTVLSVVTIPLILSLLG